MAITQDGPSAASEQPVETVARPEAARRLILVAIGWLLLAQLGGLPVGLVVGALKRFQNVSPLDPIPFTVTTFLAGCILLVAVRNRSAVVGHGNRRAGVGDQPITRWWLLVVLAFLVATWAFAVSVFWLAAVPQWLSSWRGESPWTLVAFAVVTVVFDPLAEELFHRGWLWTGLRRHWRAFPTALLSCSLWLVSHLDRGFVLPIVLIPTAVILGFARHFCGLRAAIALHAVYNLVTVLILALMLASRS